MNDVASRLSAALDGFYEIEREVGRGGMATVFAARDLRHGRTVAIKVLDAAGAGAGERFQREIQLVAGLRHPHIVPLYDSGSAGDLCYYVMPLFEGRTLRDRLRESTPLSLEESCRIATEVADALDYAHRQGVIHRDVKPENILLEGDHAAVTDFGIARLTVADRPEAADQLTATGVIVGTPAYMSPEQVSGARDIDARSDEYSLACVVHEMLTGRPPFSGAPGRPVHVQHLSEPAPPLSATRTNLPSHLDAVVQRALAKDPAERFATTRDFALALAGKPGGAAPPSAARRPRRALVLSATAIMIAVAVLAPRSVWRRPTASQPMGTERVSLAILPLDNLSADPDNAYFSDGVLEDLLVALNRVPRLSVAARTSSFSFRGRGMSLRAIAESLHVTHVVEGSVRRAGSTIRISARLVRVAPGAADSTLWSDDFTREVKNVLSLQGELASVIASRLLVSLLPADRATLDARPAANAEAYDRYLKGRFYWNQRTAPALLKAVAFFREALAIDSGYARAYAGLADTYTMLPQTGGMRPLAARPLATAAAQRALALDSSLADAHVSVGLVHCFFAWEYAAAHQEFQRALALDSSSSQAWLFDTWALVAMGELDKALVSIKRAQQLDPLALVINTRVGTVLAFSRRYAEAEAALHRTLEINPDFPLARMELARVLAMQDRSREAIAALPATVAFAGGTPAATPGFVLAKSGRLDEARRELTRLEQTPSVSYDALAVVHAALGDRDAAIRDLEQSVLQRDISLLFLNVEPMFESLHADPRFQRIVAKLGLK
jgi:serine/threonine-protein kinase